MCKAGSDRPLHLLAAEWRKKQHLLLRLLNVFTAFECVWVCDRIARVDFVWFRRIKSQAELQKGPNRHPICNSVSHMMALLENEHWTPPVLCGSV